MPRRATIPTGPAEEDLHSRTDARRARREVEDSLARLAKDLVDLSERKLGQLELPEVLFDAVQSARAISSAPARNRQLRVVRSSLREMDWGKVRARLDALLKHGTVSSASSESTAGARESEWVVRLAGEGTPALDELLQDHPRGDRNHLRALIRTVQRGTGERRKKAEEKLVQALRSLLRD